MRQNCVTQFFQLIKHWFCDVWFVVVTEENWALSADQSWLKVLQFLVHHIHVLSILLRMQWFRQDSENCSGLDWQQTTKK